MKTRIDNFSPKAACYIIFSVLFFVLSFFSLHDIIPQWSHQADHAQTWQIKAQQCEMCRPFWLCQSWWHAEQLLIRRQVWQSLSPSSNRRVRLPHPNRVRGRAEGGRREADGGGERKRRESRSRSESEKREEMGARERYSAREGRGVRKRAGGYH